MPTGVCVHGPYAGETVSSLPGEDVIHGYRLIDEYAPVGRQFDHGVYAWQGDGWSWQGWDRENEALVQLVATASARHHEFRRRQRHRTESAEGISV